MTDRSNPRSSDHLRRFEPLPREFSDADRSLDAQLQNLAGQAQMPPGLPERVFAASRTLLPAPAEFDASSNALRFPGSGTGPLRLTRRVGARLATAAAVGLLAAVTWWSTWQGTTPQPGSREAIGPAGVTIVVTDARLEARDVAWHAADELDAAFERISTYLVAAEEIRSTFDVETELVGLFPELAPGSAPFPVNSR